MRQVCAYGVELSYLDKNPARIRGPKPARRIILPFESWDEVDAVAAKAGVSRPPDPLRRGDRATPAGVAGPHLGRRGLRRGPPARPPDRPERPDSPTGKTDGSLRTVELQGEALDALRPRRIGGLIFTAPVGGIINLSNFRKRVWKPALEKAKVEYRALDMTRHSFATFALAAGAPVEWVSAQLGHTNVQTTMRHYARFLPVTSKRNVGLLDAFAADSRGQKTDSGAEADA